MARRAARERSHEFVRDAQARRSARRAADRRAEWRFKRALHRVHVVDSIVADYATSYCGRPYQRDAVVPMSSAVELPGVTWSIEGEPMVEFLPADHGPGRLLVYEIALLQPLKKELRTRHVTIEYCARPLA